MHCLPHAKLRPVARKARLKVMQAKRVVAMPYCCPPARGSQAVPRGGQAVPRGWWPCRVAAHPLYPRPEDCRGKGAKGAKGAEGAKGAKGDYFFWDPFGFGGGLKKTALPHI